jgi:glutathione S-transferase
MQARGKCIAHNLLAIGRHRIYNSAQLYFGLLKGEAMIETAVGVSNYGVAMWGLWTILFTAFAQTLIATGAHRKQSVYVPGQVHTELGHQSFVFRSHRTFQNTLENLTLMLGPALLAILTGMNAYWLGILVWVFALARIAHMALYYMIATEKNPSPRSYFFMIGLLSNLVLFIMLAVHLAT